DGGGVHVVLNVEHRGRSTTVIAPTGTAVLQVSVRVVHHVHTPSRARGRLHDETVHQQVGATGLLQRERVLARRQSTNRKQRLTALVVDARRIRVHNGLQSAVDRDLQRAVAVAAL